MISQSLGPQKFTKPTNLIKHLFHSYFLCILMISYVFVTPFPCHWFKNSEFSIEYSTQCGIVLDIGLKLI